VCLIPQQNLGFDTMLAAFFDSYIHSTINLAALMTFRKSLETPRFSWQDMRA